MERTDILIDISMVNSTGTKRVLNTLHGVSSWNTGLIFVSTVCVQAAKALASLCIYAGSPKSSLLKNVISTNITCAVSNRGCTIYGFNDSCSKQVSVWSILLFTCTRADPGTLERGFICLKVLGFALVILSHFFLHIPWKWNNLVSLSTFFFSFSVSITRVASK